MSKFSNARYAALLLFAAMSLSSAAFAQSSFDDPGSRGGGTQGGDLKPVADKVEAGGVGVGSSSQVVVLFRNDDTKPLKTGAINLYPSSNISAAVGENQCAASAINPGEVCAISIQVKGLQSGKYRIEMLMRHDGRAKLLTTTINGDVESSANGGSDLGSDIETLPNSIDFGTLNESRAQVKAVILRNKTSKPLKIESVDIEAGAQSGFSVNTNCDEMPTGSACVATVAWAPEQKGPSTGMLIVRHSGATGVSTVELKGIYDPGEAEAAKVFPSAVPGKGLLVSSKEEVDFGTGIDQSSSISVSLVNVGDVPLTLTGIRMSNADSGVHTDKTGCQTGSILAPMEACPLTMIWDPVREGNIVDDVQVSHTGARGVLIIPLRGSASKAINRDTKAINLSGPGPEAIIKNIQPLSLKDMGDDDKAGDDKGDAVSEDGDMAYPDKDKAGKGKSHTGKSSAGKGEVSSNGAPRQVDVRGVLEGYTITSYSTKRAIVSGPGGSRVVFDGEQAVIGGVLWQIVMRPSAVEFQSGTQKVLLLFDRSLSSLNLDDGQSTNGSNNSSSNSSSSSSTNSNSTRSNSSNNNP